MTEAHPSPAAPAYGLSLLSCCRLPLRQLGGLLPRIFMCFLKEKAALLEVEQMLSNSAEGLQTPSEQQKSQPFIPPDVG